MMDISMAIRALEDKADDLQYDAGTRQDAVAYGRLAAELCKLSGQSGQHAKRGPGLVADSVTKTIEQYAKWAGRVVKRLRRAAAEFESGQAVGPPPTPDLIDSTNLEVKRLKRIAKELRRLEGA